MKTKLMLMMVFLLCVVLGREAQAFYNPSNGRWLSRDPIEEAGGLNLYVFCLNTPTSAVDLKGRFPLRATQPLNYMCGGWHIKWQGAAININFRAYLVQKITIKGELHQVPGGL